MNPIEEFMQATYATCLSAGLDIVPFDTAARVMAILYVWGNNEGFTMSNKFKCERVYIQKKYRLNGGEKPDIDFVIAIKGYIKELEQYEREHPDDRTPKWAKELIQNRYGFKLYS